MNGLSTGFGKIRSVVFSSENISRPKGNSKSKREAHSAELTAEIRTAIQTDVEALHQRARKQFGYKRTDINFDLSDSEVGRLNTPDFDYTVKVFPSAEVPGEVKWLREFGFQQNADGVYDERTIALFGDELDTITVTFQTAVDIAGLVDQIEAVDSGDVKIDYDLQCTWCELAVSNVPANVRLQGSELRLTRRPGVQVSVTELISLIEPKRFGLDSP